MDTRWSSHLYLIGGRHSDIRILQESSSHLKQMHFFCLAWPRALVVQTFLIYFRQCCPDLRPLPMQTYLFGHLLIELLYRRCAPAMAPTPFTRTHVSDLGSVSWMDASIHITAWLCVCVCVGVCACTGMTLFIWILYVKLSLVYLSMEGVEGVVIMIMGMIVTMTCRSETAL